ncbi:MAG: PIN domain-containing protein [Acidobacteria bacterium]|nr:PIN domain-containing protein [Acidobacteriota bacterium]MCI0625564.1 PIN domain-containing protein [Acidobacteriota bacterium]MCI0719551.1 PIN domain-containing protein [Acidobacteriota bacterium]
MNAILLDTGPLVGLFDKRDSWHAASRAAFRKLNLPLVATWPVITESMYLLSFSHEAQDAVWEFIEQEDVIVAELGPDDCTRMRKLMWKYKSLSMDLADAALVCAAERDSLRQILTFDHKHFSIYRILGKDRFQIIP